MADAYILEISLKKLNAFYNVRPIKIDYEISVLILMRQAVS